MKKLLTSVCMVLGLMVATSALVPAPAKAASLPTPVTQFAACDAGSFFGFPTWYACLPKDPDGHPKLTKLDDVWLIAFPLLETGIKAAGYTAVGFILWGGIRFTKSQGNPGEITAARDTIRDALIGLIICVSSVAIVQFIASRL
jgi:hypothetical protein